MISLQFWTVLFPVNPLINYFDLIFIRLYQVQLFGYSIISQQMDFLKKQKMQLYIKLILSPIHLTKNPM